MLAHLGLSDNSAETKDPLTVNSARFDRRDGEAAARIDRQLAREERARRSRRNALMLVVGTLVLGIALLAVGLIAWRNSSTAAAASQSRAVAAAPAASAAGQTEAVTPSAKRAATDTAAVAPSGPAAVTAPAVTAVAPSPKSARKPAAKQGGARKPQAQRVAAKPKVVSARHLSIAVGAAGYEPSRIEAPAGVPITLTVGKGEGCAAGFNIPGLGVHLDNSAGAATAKLGKLKRGTYTYVCSMGMVSGKLVVR